MLLTKNNRNCCEFHTFAITGLENTSVRNDQKMRKPNRINGLRCFSKNEQLTEFSLFVLGSWCFVVIHAERETALIRRSTKNQEPGTNASSLPGAAILADGGNRVPYLVEQFPFNQESITQGTDQHGVRCLRCREFTRRYSSKD